METRSAARDIEATAEREEFAQLLSLPIETSQRTAAERIDGVRIGILVGFAENGVIPLVLYADQPVTAAHPARTTIDLHAAHLRRQVVLMFEDGDPLRPIILGCLREVEESTPPNGGDHMYVESDGQRVVVTAKDQIVLRCGKASITLTKDGKVLVQGAYVSNQSSGVLRIRGGSVQIN